MSEFSDAFVAARKKHGGDGGVFEFQGKKYTTDLAKSAAKKDLEKAAKGVGAQLAGEATTALTGSETAGKMLQTGMMTGFDPLTMGVAAGIGILSSAQKRKERRAEGKAMASKERARGMEAKARIQGEMASAISSVLGGSGRIRGVNL